MRALLRLLLAVAFAGCTWVNAPKEPPDGGFADAAQDADVADGDADAPDASDLEECTNGVDDDGDGAVDCDDVDCEGRPCDGEGGCLCQGGRATETLCANGADDDGDGLADCADYDCASQPNVDCCEADDPPPTWPDEESTWPQAQSELEAEWQTTSASGALPVRRDGFALTEFADADPFALVHRTCLSLALGATFEAGFAPQGEESRHGCAPDGGRCKSFAALVLGPARSALPGRRLLDDLAVVFYPNGRVEVTQGGSAFVAGELSTLAVEYRATVELTPAIDPAGRAALRAEVRVGRPGMDPELAWEGYPLLQEQLIDDGLCADVPGLYLAFEGFGDGVVVNQLHEAAPRACLNPSQFSRSAAILTADGADDTASLGLSPPSTGAEWADEAIGSPSLLRVGGDNWHVMVEATNDQPELELVAHVGYAIGHGCARGWPSDVWPDGDQEPRLGEQPPSCLDMSCTTLPTSSFRDPHLFEKAGYLFAAVAVEIFTDAVPTGTHAIYIVGAGGMGEITLPSAPLLEPAGTSCDDLRDPVVTARPGGSAGVDYWLFFTCLRGGLGSIAAVPLIDVAGWRLPEGAEPVIVLAPEDVGSFGAGGLRSPAIVLDQKDGEVTFRLWFLGQSRAGTAAVGLALGAPKNAFPGAADRATFPDRPVFEPYRANPVLQSTDRAFRGCEGCTIEGLGVTRVDDSLLRLLVARRVPLTSGRRYELVPLDQLWRP